MFSFDMTDEQKMLVDTVHRFAEQQIDVGSDALADAASKHRRILAEELLCRHVVLVFPFADRGDGDFRQRIDFGHGKERITAGTSSAMISSAALPGLTIWAT